MHQAFGTVIWVVCIVAAVLAVIALVFSGRTWAEHGKGGMVMDHDAPSEGGARASASERDAEIRELISARNARRLRRGEPPLDVEAELARLTSPAPPAEVGRTSRQGAAPADEFSHIDPELREEVRQLVVARNNRRVRAGKPPLDVEEEVVRELRKVSQL